VARRYHDLIVSAFVQATEDRAKVEKAMENLLGFPVADQLEVSIAEGVHNNPIEYITFRLKRERIIRQVIGRWEEMSFWQEAKKDLDDRMDEGLTYHVRVDKASAYQDDIRLWKGGEALDIKLKPATYPSSRSGAKTIIEQGPVETL
jgi:RNA binding exosome subunit